MLRLPVHDRRFTHQNIVITLIAEDDDTRQQSAPYFIANLLNGHHEKRYHKTATMDNARQLFRRGVARLLCCALCPNSRQPVTGTLKLYRAPIAPRRTAYVHPEKRRRFNTHPSMSVRSSKARSGSGDLKLEKLRRLISQCRSKRPQDISPAHRTELISLGAAEIRPGIWISNQRRIFSDEAYKELQEFHDAEFLLKLLADDACWFVYSAPINRGLRFIKFFGYYVEIFFPRKRAQ